MLNVSGTIARLALIRQLGETFESPLQGIGGFIAEYRIQIFIVSAIVVAWSVYNEFFSSEGEAHSLVELAREEEADDGSGPAVGTGTGNVADPANNPKDGSEFEDPVESDG